MLFKFSEWIASFEILGMNCHLMCCRKYFLQKKVVFFFPCSVLLCLHMWYDLYKKCLVNMMLPLDCYNLGIRKDRGLQKTIHLLSSGVVTSFDDFKLYVSTSSVNLYIFYIILPYFGSIRCSLMFMSCFMARPLPV